MSAIADAPLDPGDVPCVRYLSPAGGVIGELPAFASDRERLMAFYRAMLLTRAFDARAVALQRTGRLGTFASSLGQEAVGVGVASAMRPDDVLVPSFRDQAAQLWRGVTMCELLLYWAGDERGSDFRTPREDFPVCIPVATQFPHAIGIALAMQLRRQNRAVVAIGGDGSTSKGDFYEAINVAGVWRLPVVFVINNNQWAISTPRHAQSAAATLARKAVAAGIPGIQVDGNDVVAVHEVASRALEQARRGEGPTLIEALTYRLADHTTADDARRYRDDNEVTRRWKEEPVARLRQFLISTGDLANEREVALQRDCQAEVEAAVAAFAATPAQEPVAMFDHLFEQAPESLRDARRSLASGGRQGDG